MTAGHPTAAHAAWLEAIADFTTYLVRDLSRSPGTVRLRRNHLRRLAHRSDSGPWATTTTDLLDWLAGPGWAPESRKSTQASLRVFYAWATATGRTSYDPAQQLPAVSIPRALPRPIPDQMTRRALSDADGRERLMVLLAGYCGLRAAEIAQVNGRDLYLESLLVHGKGGHERMVPVADGELLAALRAADHAPGGWLFPGRVDGHLSAGYVCRLLSRLLPGHYTGHQLRHRAATVAYETTGDLRAVQEMLGHASSRTTERYTLVSTRSLRAVAAQAAAGLT
jgi:site-specific recombinase XerD